MGPEGEVTISLQEAALLRHGHGERNASSILSKSREVP